MQTTSLGCNYCCLQSMRRQFDVIEELDEFELDDEDEEMTCQVCRVVALTVFFILNSTKHWKVSCVT